MKNTIIYLIRHAETLDENGVRNTNEDSQIINEKEILSVHGEEQSKRLSENVELNNIDVIWSSSYTRAKATAKYIANNNNLPINLDSNLNERKLGIENEDNLIGKGLSYCATCDGNFYKGKDVAIVGGGGWHSFRIAQNEDYDIFISGDMPHHARREVISYKFNYLDLPHEIEKIFMKQMKMILLEINPSLEIISLDHEVLPKVI